MTYYVLDSALYFLKMTNYVLDSAVYDISVMKI